MMAIQKQFELRNKEGLHARPAMKLVETASRFEADISIRFEGREVNAKSIMSVLTLGAGKGAVLEFEFRGDDAEHAVTALFDLFEGKFDEE